jgi:two-component system LytT family response regulator
MIRSIIIDDEPQNNKILRHFLETYCHDVVVIAEATEPQQALSLISEMKPQLLFLDIELPGQNAFCLLNQLMPVDFEIIFVTAYNQYALNAIKYNALDYLLKPINIDELRQAVEKVNVRLAEKNINERLANFFHNQAQILDNSRIALPTQEGLTFYPIKDIVNCEAEGPYTRFHFISDKSIIVTGTLKEFEQLLPSEMFCRVHHSYLVNLNRIHKYFRGKGGYLEMDNGKTVEVSQRKKEGFMARLKMENLRFG